VPPCLADVSTCLGDEYVFMGHNEWHKSVYYKLEERFVWLACLGSVYRVAHIS
jgi:hypothetical protein